MTEAELTLLRSLAETDVVTFMPEDNTVAALARFEATVASLRDMEKAGWIELEVAQDEKRKRGLFDRVLASDLHEPWYNFLIDRREITSVPSRETVDRIIDYYRSHAQQFGRCRLASVTRSDPAYGMTRMASVFAERTTVEVGVFRDFAEARRWLASRSS